MRRAVSVVLVVLVCLAASVALAQTDSPKTSTSVFDLQTQLSPVTLGSGTQYVSGTGIRLAASATSGAASFLGADAPFWVNNVVPSWNLDMPAGAGAHMEIRAVNGGSATSWYDIGRIGTLPGGLNKKKSDSYGYIDIDTLMLYATWPRIEYRVTLYTNAVGVTPTLRLMSVCYADTTTRIAYVSLPNPGAATSLPVPWRSQYWVPGIGGVICGPTSLSMAEHYYGCNLPTETVAAQCYDDESGIYGNWPFIAQAAAKNGFKAYTFRANTQQPLRDQFAAGNAVIMSMNYSAGELTNSPISSTGGHLVLMVGVTANGDYLCNDPAGSDSRWDHVTYYKNQIAHVWLYHAGGVCIAVMPNLVYGRYPYFTYKSTDPVAIGRNGRMDVFARGTNGFIYRASQSSTNGAFSPWVGMGGAAASDPVAVTNRTGGTAVFARFTNDIVYYAWQNGPGGTWASFASLGGPVVGRPAVGKSPDGRMDLFCRMPDGSIQHRWEDGAGGWQAWASLGGAMAGDPVVALNSEGRQEVFARGADSQLYHAWQLNDGSWSGWSSLGGPIAGDPTAGRTSDGRVEVYCRFADGSIRCNRQTGTLVGTSWTGWSVLTGAGDANVAVGRTPAFLQEIYRRDGSNGQVQRAYQTSVDGSWSAWEALGGYALGAPIVAHHDDGRIVVFIFQTDGRMWMRSQLSGGGWSSWTSMGSALFPENVSPLIGSVTASPALAAAGDTVTITAQVTDNVSVSSVTANGVSLANAGGGNWTGALTANSALGPHGVTIEAHDPSGNLASDSSAAYTTARVLATTNRAVWDPMMSTANASFLFVVFGRVTVVDSGVFTLDDGSGSPVEIHASNHGLTTGSFVRVRGMLIDNGPQDRFIQSSAGLIAPL